jgi:hypothetical protein
VLVGGELIAGELVGEELIEEELVEEELVGDALIAVVAGSGSEATPLPLVAALPATDSWNP